MKRAGIFVGVTGVLLSLITSSVLGQDFIPIWPKDHIPNSKHLKLEDSIANERIYRVMNPGMYAFFPGKQETPVSSGMEIINNLLNQESLSPPKTMEDKKHIENEFISTGGNKQSKYFLLKNNTQHTYYKPIKIDSIL